MQSSDFDESSAFGSMTSSVENLIRVQAHRSSAGNPATGVSLIFDQYFEIKKKFFEKEWAGLTSEVIKCFLESTTDMLQTNLEMNGLDVKEHDFKAKIEYFKKKLESVLDEKKLAANSLEFMALKEIKVVVDRLRAQILQRLPLMTLSFANQLILSEKHRESLSEDPKHRDDGQTLTKIIQSFDPKDHAKSKADAREAICPSEKKRTTLRLPKRIQRLLSGMMDARHLDDTYLNSDEKQKLAVRFQITRKQVDR